MFNKVNLTETDTPFTAWEKGFPDTYLPIPLQAVLNGETVPVDSHKLIMRSDGKPISVMKSSYEITQPRDSMNQAFGELFETGLVTLDSVGSTKGGARIFGLGRIKGGEQDIVPGDPVDTFLLMATSFDGSLPWLLKGTNVRPICENTLAMAIAEASEINYKFKHTKTIHERIEAAKETVKQYLQQFNKTVEAYRVLANKKASVRELNNYFFKVFDPENVKPEERSAQLVTKVNRVLELLEDTREYVPATIGTYWQGYNAVTKYLTHEQGRNDETRLDSNLFGANALVNQNALHLALSL